MHYTNFSFISLVRRIWRSTFGLETIFRRSIRLKQTDRTCWTIQTHSDELNWGRRQDVSFMCILYSVGLKMEDPSFSISIDYFQSSFTRILNGSFSFHKNQRWHSNTRWIGRSIKKNQWQVEKAWRRLQFDEAQITDHDKKDNELSEKAYYLLMAWKCRDASNATYRVLHKALSDVQRRDLAQEFFCQWKRYYTIFFAL